MTKLMLIERPCKIAAVPLVVLILAGGNAGTAHGQPTFGGELGKLGGQAASTLHHGGGSISDVLKQGAGAVEGAAAHLDPSAALLREYKQEQSRAIGEIRWFNPGMIVQQVEASLRERVDAAVLRSGTSFNAQTGDVDLRSTAMGRTLQNWLFQFAQGNHREAGLPEFRFNVPNRTLVVRLYARHRQSWGKVFPGQGPVDLIDVTQKAVLSFNFNTGKGDFSIDTGPWGPKITPGALDQLESGDLIGIAQAMTPEAFGNLARLETGDDLDEIENSYFARYGRGNIYFASRSFAEFATPERLAKYTVNGIISLGTDVWPEIMADLQQQAQAELPPLAMWLESRGQQDAGAIAGQLLSGRVPELPTISFQLIQVPFRSRNVTPVGVATPWRNVNHITFAVYWHPAQYASPGGGAQGAGPVVNPGANANVGDLEAERRQRLATLEHQQELERLRQAAQRPGDGGPGGGDGPPPGNNGPGEFFAQNLGITYQAIPFGDGTFGAKLTRYPAPGSPGAQLQLEPGDIITVLDGAPIRSPEDVLSHRNDTTVRLINVRTNSPVDTQVFIP